MSPTLEVYQIRLSVFSETPNFLYLESTMFGPRLLTIALFLGHLFFQIMLGHMLVPSPQYNDPSFGRCLAELLTSADLSLSCHWMQWTQLCAHWQVLLCSTQNQMALWVAAVLKTKDMNDKWHNHQILNQLAPLGVSLYHPYQPTLNWVIWHQHIPRRGSSTQM